MDDLISRQAAILGLMKEATADGAYGYIDTKTACDVIKELPTAEPSTTLMQVEVGVDKEMLKKAMEEAELTLVAEPKKGKWIKDECGSVICSECKAYRRDSRINHIRFCNACGARMEESDE